MGGVGEGYVLAWEGERRGGSVHEEGRKERGWWCSGEEGEEGEWKGKIRS